MRTLLALVFSAFTSSRRRQAAKPCAPTAAPAPAPAHRVPAALEEELRGEDVVLVRPYVVAWERHVAREFERERQRDRRTAAAFAAMGADFLGVPA